MAVLRRWSPFKPKDAELFSIISGFDAAYSAYNAYQNGIERYWTLKYLQQNGITEITATSFKDSLVRADELPLVLPATGALGLPRGAKLRIKLGQIDEITLDITGAVVERLDAAATGGGQSDEATYSAEYDGAGEDDDLSAGPIAIAVDLSEPTDDTATPAAAS